jgi:hypothetical protein
MAKWPDHLISYKQFEKGQMATTIWTLFFYPKMLRTFNISRTKSFRSFNGVLEIVELISNFCEDIFTNKRAFHVFIFLRIISYFSILQNLNQKKIFCQIKFDKVSKGWLQFTEFFKFYVKKQVALLYFVK